MGRVTRLFEGARLTRRRFPSLELPPAPAAPEGLKEASPREVRRAFAGALHESRCLPDFELRESQPVFVRKRGEWIHRVEVRAEGRYQVRGRFTPIDLTATVENRRVKDYLFARQGRNLRRPTIDPSDDWTTAFGDAWRLIHQDWLPILDRFQGADWLDRVRSLADSSVPLPGTTIRLLLGEGDVEGARLHLVWLAAHDDRIIQWAREDLGRGPAPAGQARATLGWRIAEPLRRHHCEHLINDL